MIIIDIVWTKLPTSIEIKIGIIIVFASQSPAVSGIELNQLGISNGISKSICWPSSFWSGIEFPAIMHIPMKYWIK